MDWRLIEILKLSRLDPVRLVNIQTEKVCYAVHDFVHAGRKIYARKWGSREPLVELSFESSVARQLVDKGVVSVIRGGECDTFQVRTGTGDLPAYRPWQKAREPAEAHDQIMLRVELLKHVQIIPTLPLLPGAKFYLPYWLIESIGFNREDDPRRNQPLLLFSDQRVYEPETAVS